MTGNKDPRQVQHPKRCDNGCIRRMDPEKSDTGFVPPRYNYSHYLGTLDCPAQLNARDIDNDEGQVISACGCASYLSSMAVLTPTFCWLRKGDGDSAECECHNTPIIYSTCLSKITHGCCPFGFKGDDPDA